MSRVVTRHNVRWPLLVCQCKVDVCGFSELFLKKVLICTYCILLNGRLAWKESWVFKPSFFTECNYAKSPSDCSHPEECKICRPHLTYHPLRERWAQFQPRILSANNLSWQSFVWLSWGSNPQLMSIRANTTNLRMTIADIRQNLVNVPTLTLPPTPPPLPPGHPKAGLCWQLYWHNPDSTGGSLLHVFPSPQHSSSITMRSWACARRRRGVGCRSARWDTYWHPWAASCRPVCQLAWWRPTHADNRTVTEP